MLLTRAPSPALAPFIERLWLCDEPAGAAGVDRERVLPGRTIQIVLRLDDPLRVFDREGDAQARTIGHAVVCGARSTYYVRETRRAQRCIGVRIHPAAAESIVGAPGDELADRLTPLDAIWGRAAEDLRQHLLDVGDPRRQLAALEEVLAARVSRGPFTHAFARHAAERLASGLSVRDAVSESGYSHRAFIALFRRAVGLSPKVYARVLRFRRSLDLLAQHGLARDGRGPLLMRVALEAGYADHAHFTRELRSMAGLGPREYLRLAPRWSTHVPIAPSG